MKIILDGISPDELIERIVDRVRKVLKDQEPAASPGELPEFMTRKEVAAFLQISLATVDNYTKWGILKKHYIGGLPRFKRDEVREVFENPTINKK